LFKNVIEVDPKAFESVAIKIEQRDQESL